MFDVERFCFWTLESLQQHGRGIEDFFEVEVQFIFHSPVRNHTGDRVTVNHTMKTMDDFHAASVPFSKFQSFKMFQKVFEMFSKFEYCFEFFEMEMASFCFKSLAASEALQLGGSHRRSANVRTFGWPPSEAEHRRREFLYE